MAGASRKPSELRQSQPERSKGSGEASQSSVEMSVLERNLLEAVSRLRQRADVVGNDFCSERVLAALESPEVRQRFLGMLSSGATFENAFCLGGFTPYEDRVVFQFRRAPPTIDLLPQRFLVRLDLETGAVADILDPAPNLIPLSEQFPTALFRLG
jgi:hypothetical protein